MAKKTPLIMLCLTVVSLGLSACGGGGGGGSKGGETPVPSAQGYEQGTPAATSTTPDSILVSSESGDAVELILDDDSSAVVPTMAAGFEASFERGDAESSDIDEVVEATQWQPSGASRRLTIAGDGDPSDLKPVITIPIEEAGSLNLETVNVLRIGDIWLNGERIPNHRTMLPVTVTEEGDLQFVDPLMRESLAQSSEPAAASIRQTAAAEDYQWVGSTRYVLMSFQQDLNWQREPQLVRMIPDPDAEDSGYRRPATEAEQTALARQPICSVVILVHGHNEEEKQGSYTPSADAPWLFSYKQRVWNLFYREILAEQAQDPLYPHTCIAFYEYIFPSYRPIFSPVPDKSGQVHETLGEALGRLVKTELEGNAQLKALMDNDMPFNVMVAAHSQGGLVARSGFRHMPSDFKSRIKRLVTWGTPHHGAGLFSLRYALQSGHDMVVDGRLLPLSSIGNSWITGDMYQGALNRVALDTPGVRDLRWDASKRDMVNLRQLFPSITDDNEDDIKPGLFSDNLAEFNNNMGDELDSPGARYSFIYGVTPKNANLELGDSDAHWWWQYQTGQVLKFAESSSIEQGATLNQLVMESGYRTSDGAAPLYSQRGEGLWGPPVTYSMNDVDHEEFYGSEPESQGPGSLYKGVLTAQKTFDIMELQHTSRQCPEIEATIENNDDQAIVEGRVLFPLYDGADVTLGQSIAGIEARAGGEGGSVISSFSFSQSSDGSFTGQAPAGDVPAGAVAIVAVLKDGSELPITLQYSESLDFTRALFTDSASSWTITEARDGHVVANTEWVKQGVTQQCDVSLDWTVPQSVDAPLELTITRQWLRDGQVSVGGFHVSLIDYMGPVLEVSGGGFASQNGFEVDPSTASSQTEQGNVQVISFLPEVRSESSYYDKSINIYLEIEFLCGSSESTGINLDYF